MREVVSPRVLRSLSFPMDLRFSLDVGARVIDEPDAVLYIAALCAALLLRVFEVM